MPPLHNTDFEPNVNTQTTQPSSEIPGHAPVQHPDPAHALPEPHRISAGMWIACVIVLIVILVGIGIRLLQRSSAESSLEKSTQASAIPTVVVIQPITAVGGSDLALPG